MGREPRDEETPTMPLIVVRVTAETLRVDEFVARFARYFRGDDIVFVPTEGIQPPGRRVRFVFALADGADLVSGEGVVLRMRRDSGDARRPPGMELRYQILDEESQLVVERLLAARRPTPPPPYVSMRIDGVSESQQVTLPHPQVEPEAASVSLLPSLVEPPPIPPPSPATRLAMLATLPSPPSPHAPRGARLLGVGVATAAAMMAMAIAMAMIRHAPTSAVAVGGNGFVVAAALPAGVSPPVADGPRPASTGGARPPPPPARGRAATRPVALHVSTSPTGSTVFIDGQERGPSPLTVTVAAGAHDIIVERPRWVAAHAHVDGPGRVQLTLSRPTARLRVTSTPPGAAVRLDGRDVGTTPLDVDAAAYELHHVQLEMDGHVWKRKIYLRPPGGAVRVGAARRSVDEPGAVRVAHDLGERVRP